MEINGARILVGDIDVFPDAVSLVISSRANAPSIAISLTTQSDDWSGPLTPDTSRDGFREHWQAERSAIHVVQAQANEVIASTTLWIERLPTFITVEAYSRELDHVPSGQARVQQTIDGESLREARRAALQL